ncbi:MAG: chromate transporter [Alphaproteobacteria bacterium]|nr:chromate transporter [Alphaproteobacteria bacterium]
MLLELFWSFFKIGLFTFGGGYAMIPLLQSEIVERKNWVSEEEIMDYYSIGQCTPGIIAVNVSTFTGYKLRGIKGAVAATLGIVCPSLIIITALANILNILIENEAVNHAFSGIRIVVIALMADVIINMWRKNIKDFWQFMVFAIAVTAMVFWGASPFWIIIAAAFFGLVLRKGN